MRIALDFIVDEIANIERAKVNSRVEHIPNLIENLVNIDGKNDYILFSRLPKPLPKLSYAPTIFSLKRVIVSAPNPMDWYKSQALRQALKKEEIDVYHGLFFMIPMKCPCKSVVSVYSMERMYHLRPDCLSACQPLHSALIDSAKSADCIIVPSKSFKEEMLMFYGISESKVKVIYHGASQPYKQIKDDDLISLILKKYGIKRPYIYASDGLSYDGDPLVTTQTLRIIYAFSKIKKLFPNFKLVFRGDLLTSYPECPNFIKIVQQLNLKIENDIIWPGNIPMEEEPAIFSGAKMFVQLEIADFDGSDPLRAMACGTPILASNAAAMQEYVGNAGLLVNPFNNLEISEAMYTLLTNETLREKLGEKGLQRAMTFSWEKAAEETLALYEELK